MPEVYPALFWATGGVMDAGMSGLCRAGGAKPSHSLSRRFAVAIKFAGTVVGHKD